MSGVKKEPGILSYTKGGKDYWRIDVWLELPDGKRRRKQVSSIPSLDLARKFRDKLRTEAFEGRYFDRPKANLLTVEEAWENYEPVTKRDNKSWRSDNGRAGHLVKHLGTKKTADLTLRDIDTYRTKRLAEPTPRGNPPLAATLNHEIGLLSRFLNYAVKCGELARNPVARMKRLPEDNVRQVAVSESEFEKLYSGANDVLKPMLVVAYDTGMRRGEIFKLKWSQVDLKEGTIRLANKDTKTEKPRIIVLTDRTKQALERVPTSISGFVFVNPQKDKPWYDIKKMFKKACEAAELEGVWFHDLRRSFITNARRRGVAESVVMRMSGHKTRNVFERYNVVNEEDLRSAVERIELGREAELAEADSEDSKKKSGQA